jgi:hypothetical protein
MKPGINTDRRQIEEVDPQMTPIDAETQIRMGRILTIPFSFPEICVNRRHLRINLFDSPRINFFPIRVRSGFHP